MKCLVKLFCAVVVALPIAVNAGWQVAQPSSVPPNEPFFQAGHPQTRTCTSPKARRTSTPPTAYSATGYPNQFASLGRPAAIYAISVSGSLKENVERIMDRYHWKVIWKAPYDYNFDGRITGNSLPNVIEKLFKPFPLQATLYMSNRTMTVTSRET
jgi:hypothetical protein